MSDKPKLQAASCKHAGFGSHGLSLAVCCTLALLLGCGGKKEQPKVEAPAAAPVVARISAAVQPSATSLKPNDSYTVAYTLMNPTDVSVSVSRVVTSAGTISPGSPDWRHGVVQPGQSATVAQTSGRATQAGVLALSATFITDRGAYDAPPVRITVTGAAPAGIAPAAQTGRIAAQLTITPNPAQPGQPVTISYELVDSSDAPVVVTRVEFDSEFAIAPGNPNWLNGQVEAHSIRAVARRTVVKKDEGTYSFSGRLATNNTMFASPNVTLTVAAPKTVVDTGRVSAAIVITPNPASVGGTYTIDYEVTNTTLKDIEVTGISTDLGQLDAASTEWHTGTVRAGQTVVIARIDGEGNAVTSRRKTATFNISTGDVTAEPVLLVIQ